MKKLTITLALSTALGACAVGVGQDFTWEQVQSIKPGMTLEQVTGILGPPQNSSMSDQLTTVTWVHIPTTVVLPYLPPLGGKGETRQVSFTFKNGKVVGKTLGANP